MSVGAVTRSDVAVRGMEQGAGRGYDERMRHAAARHLRFLVLFGASLIGCHPARVPQTANRSPATPVVPAEPTPVVEAKPSAPETPWPTYRIAQLQGYQKLLPFILEEDGTRLRAYLSRSEYVGEVTEGPSISLRAADWSGATLEVAIMPGGGVQVMDDGRGDWYEEGSTETLEGDRELVFGGSIGGKPIRMKLVLRKGVLTGRYRYPESTSDLLLRGRLTVANDFELVERTGDRTTGKLHGSFASPDLWLGQWRSPDGTRREPVTFAIAGPDDPYPESAAYAAGTQLYAQEMSLDGDGCTFDAAYPQLRGGHDLHALAALNDALRGPRARARSCEELQTLEHGPGPGERRPVRGSETYELGTTTGRFIGIRRSSALRDMWATFRTATCWVVDAETLARVDLRSKLTPAGQTSLEILAGQRLAAQPSDSYRPRSSAAAPPMLLTPDTELCLRSTGLEVATPYKHVELRMSEVKGFFVDDPITKAMFGR